MIYFLNSNLMQIIKGCLYFSGDMILRPHYSGQFSMVDCEEYLTKEELKDRYDKEHVKEFMEEWICITYRGTKYYQAEWWLHHTDDFELLSDIGDVQYFDYETNFDE